MVFNKKAISPVVATALLLVVAVVAVVGFQTWFNTYQSGLNVKVEQQSAAGSSITVERLESDQSGCVVYLKNNAAEPVNVTSIKAGTVTLDVPTSAGFDVAKGVQNFTDATCDPGSDDSQVDVVVVTELGVFQETELIR